MKKWRLLVVPAAAFLVGAIFMHYAYPWLGKNEVVALLTAHTQPATASRPSTWAMPVDKPGLPNLYRLSPDLYRGAQPTTEQGFRQLKEMGIKTIISLRAFHDDDKDLVGNLSLAQKRLKFKTWHPEDEDIIEFVKITADANNLPAFVHCLHGSDRTGTMCAIYRIVIQGWDKEEAIREMTEGGFGFHTGFQNLPAYLRGLDVTRIRTAAGLGKTAASSPASRPSGNT